MSKKKKAKKPSWKSVFKEAQFLRCGGCTGWVKIEGDVKGRTCRKCGAPLSQAR